MQRTMGYVPVYGGIAPHGHAFVPAVSVCGSSTYADCNDLSIALSRQSGGRVKEVEDS
jgi:hypothetical protein